MLALAVLCSHPESPKTMEETPDVIGRQLVQLFHDTKTAGFLPLPLECGKCVISCFPITPTASPTTIRNHKELHTQPTRNKK
jgi:hypothetical protein